ncbi:AAA domain-containing protein [Ditylenchus destructor]|nr:AAA domain-containing protein [Ditylenchus destructor]
MAWEDDARAKQPELLILDTHLLTNKLWSQTLFGAYPAWLDSELLARHYDLHLLLSPEDVEWTADGQRCQPALADRQAFFQESLAWMQQHQETVVVIRGDWEARRKAAFAAVDKVL